MPVHTYEKWNSRPMDAEEQIEPLRKYFFICEGAKTEPNYLKGLIEVRKQLRIHPLIDIRLWEKTKEDSNLSYPKNLVSFANAQKLIDENNFDLDHDKLVIVFDGDIFEEKVQGYEELVTQIELDGDIAAVTNPNFELFLLLHIPDSYDVHIKGRENDFFQLNEKNQYKYAYNIVKDVTGINTKRNKQIGKYAKDVWIAINQEKHINQNIHQIKGKVSSNIGRVIESIIQDNPER
jgi:hypothetical protein